MLKYSRSLTKLNRTIYVGQIAVCPSLLADEINLASAILIRHIEFILLCSRSAFALPALEDGMDDSPNMLTVDEEVKAFLTEDTTRGMLQGVCERAKGLLSESHLVWQPWLEWELGWLERVSAKGRK